MPVSARLVVNTADIAIAAARAGHGITRVLSYTVEPDVRAGKLVVVLPSFEPPPLPIHVVYPEGRRGGESARLRQAGHGVAQGAKSRLSNAVGTARCLAARGGVVLMSSGVVIMSAVPSVVTGTPNILAQASHMSFIGRVEFVP